MNVWGRWSLSGVVFAHIYFTLTEMLLIPVFNSLTLTTNRHSRRKVGVFKNLRKQKTWIFFQIYVFQVGTEDPKRFHFLSLSLQRVPEKQRFIALSGWTCRACFTQVLHLWQWCCSVLLHACTSPQMDQQRLLQVMLRWSLKRDEKSLWI